MNKPLPAPSKEDDLVSTFDTLTLAVKKPPLAAPKKDSLVSAFGALTLAGENPPLAPSKEDDLRLVSTFGALTLAGKDPPLAAPKKDSLVGRLKALKLGGKKRPTATHKENVVRNSNAPAPGGKKPSAPDKKFPDAPLPLGRPALQLTFVGGFNPGLLALNIEPLPQSQQPANQHVRTATPPSRAKTPTELPRNPMPMPMPMPVPPPAREFRVARQPKSPDIPAKRTPAPAPATPPPQSDSDSIPSPKETSRPCFPNVVEPAQPVTPNRQRSAAVKPVTPSPGKVKCSAQVKKEARQCRRDVMLPATYALIDCTESTPALYCWQHKDKMSELIGFYVEVAGMQDKFVEFDHYIPEYLQENTQSALKREMQKKIATADEDGYVYTFEIQDPKRPDVIQLKVGRTNNVAQRFDQWGKQCGSKKNILRGLWPESDDQCLHEGHIRTGPPGPFCHRVERLVHIELADLSLHAPYLDPSWPNNIVSDQSSSASGPQATECVDCGRVHKEIFTFQRPENGKYNGREWNSIVKPVIEKWGRFIKEHYA